MIRLITLLMFSLFLLPSAWGLDRVQAIQSKLHSSLAAILPPSDFLIIVNRTDTLDDGGASQEVDGSFKALPGLQLGVDSKGRIVTQNFGASDYRGPVSVNVVIENMVRVDTFKTIEKLLPDIIGGLRDDDQLTVVRGPLRQAPMPGSSAPQISINNNGQQKNSTAESLKFLAILIIGGGLFFWFLSRMQMPGQKSQDGFGRGQDLSRQSEIEKPNAQTKPEDFSLLDPEGVALFLLKEVRDRREETWAQWVKSTPATHQREVFGHLPSWMLSYFKALGDRHQKDEKELATITLSQLFNEIALVEQSFKAPSQKKKAFLQWFPAQALRFVPRRYQKGLSEESKLTLWAMRPDLGNFVRLENMAVDKVMTEPTEADIEACWDELFSFPTVAFDNGNNEATDVVSRWVEMINQLNEFGPIDSQIDQARIKLSAQDFPRLLAQVGNVRTPFTFSESVRKDWLRAVHPDDYFWWLSLTKETPAWDLKLDLRPMRWAMFNQADQEKAHLQWSGDEKKKSSERLLQGFRELVQSSDRGLEHGAA